MAYDDPKRETSKEKLAREENTFGNGFMIAGIIILIIIAALAYYYFYYARTVAQNTNSDVVVPRVATGAIDFSRTTTNTNPNPVSTKTENKSKH